MPPMAPNKIVPIMAPPANELSISPRLVGLPKISSAYTGSTTGSKLDVRWLVPPAAVQPQPDQFLKTGAHSLYVSVLK
jgi:hypothetical protein